MKNLIFILLAVMASSCYTPLSKSGKKAAMGTLPKADTTKNPEIFVEPQYYLRVFSCGEHIFTRVLTSPNHIRETPTRAVFQGINSEITISKNFNYFIETQ